MTSNQKFAHEVLRIHSLFVAIRLLNETESNEGGVADLIELGESYTGMLSQRYDDQPDTAEGENHG